MPSRVIVGTAAIGQHYANQDPPSEAEVAKLLQSCTPDRVNAVEVSTLYGKAIRLVCEYLPRDVKLWLKVPPGPNFWSEVETAIYNLARPIDGLMVHAQDRYVDHKWSEDLSRLIPFLYSWCGSEMVMTGVSTYGPDAAAQAYRSHCWDLVCCEASPPAQACLEAIIGQLPLMIDDDLFTPMVSVRSIFMRSHIFAGHKEMGPLAKAAKKVGMSIAEYAFKAMLSHDMIPHVVVGPRNADELDQLLAWEMDPPVQPDWKKLSTVKDLSRFVVDHSQP